MSSKLFHTVVAFGITLGAATVGCSAEPVETPATSEDAVITTDNSEATDTKAATAEGEPAPAPKDRFCEVAWPTTKGGPRPTQAQACIDPQHECGVYPGGVFSRDTCFEANEENTCSGREAWMFCKTTAAGSKEWTCPSGTIKLNQCVWPDPDGTTKGEPPANGAYGG